MSEGSDPSARPARAPTVAWRVVDGEAVMVLPSTAQVHTLNRVGTRFWELADGSRSLDQIVDALGEEFDAERELIERDCHAFLADLAERRLIEPRSA